MRAEKARVGLEVAFAPEGVDWRLAPGAVVRARIITSDSIAGQCGVVLPSGLGVQTPLSRLLGSWESWTEPGGGFETALEALEKAGVPTTASRGDLGALMALLGPLGVAYSVLPGGARVAIGVDDLVALAKRARR